jgi:predicted nucleotidyltransferase
MKYLFVLLLASVSYLGASAQSYSRTSPYVNSYGQSYTDQFQRRLNDINRIYDNRINDVKYDRTLSNHQKRKLIRGLEEERKIKVKAYRKWERKEKRRLRREGYFD